MLSVQLRHGFERAALSDFESERVVERRQLRRARHRVLHNRRVLTAEQRHQRRHQIRLQNEPRNRSAQRGL